MRDDYLTADQVGEELRVTAARVRQLADERKIPRPLAFGPRANLWQRSAIEVCERRMSSPRLKLTGQSALFEDAPSPLQRTNDVVVPFNIRGWTSDVHARIWQGSAMEGHRIVVVTSRPVNNPYADVNIERIVEMIDDRFLAGRGSEAMWFEAYLDEAGGRGPRFSLSNLVLGCGRPDKRSWNAGRYRDPIWIEQEIAEIDRITGTNVEWWPPAAYRSEEILRWQRDGGLLTVEDDRYELGPLQQALSALRSIGPDERWYNLAQKAIIYIAPEMAIKDELYGVPWDDGTTTQVSERWPTRFAARLTPRRLDEEARDLVLTISSGAAADELDLSALDRELRAWLNEVDEFGDKSNPDSAAAVRTVLEVLERNDEGVSESPSDPVPRVFDIAGPTDKKFLDGLTWVTGKDIDRSRRQLHHELGMEGEIEYATAFDKHLVARKPGDDVFAVMWPTRGDTILSDDCSLVGDRSTGDRPVYIEEGGMLVGFLDLGPHHFRDWNWGYPGGVDSLASAIIHHLRDGHPDGEFPRGWIEDFLGYAIEPSMRLDIIDILRRSAQTT